MTGEWQGPLSEKQMMGRAIQKAMRDSRRANAAEREMSLAAVRKWLSIGGEARLKQGAAAEIFDVSGPKRERQTGAGYTTIVPPLLDPRIKLTPEQRAAGATYAAFLEQTLGGTGTEWLREFVDGGSSGSGGVSESNFFRMYLVKVARAAMAKQKLLRYPLGKKRGKIKRGPHKPIPATDLVDHVTVGGRSLSFVAIQYGWTSERRGKQVVPDRQRKWIGIALGKNLDLIREAWSEAGLNPPGDMASIDLE